MIDNTKLYQVDAFTEEAFKGNPAGVMLVDDTVESSRMQKIAVEMNLSETAFIIPETRNTFRIRYFTPASEVPLCGHATLASAHILYELGVVKNTDAIHFRAKGANLKIRRDANWISMNFPEYPLTPIDIPKHFKETIGFEPVEVYSSSYGWIMAVAGSEKEIREADPVFSVMESRGLGFLMITAASEMEGIDFVLRCFGPVLGVNEDPVTGSAHCALTPLWTGKLDKKELTSFQLSKRTGSIKVKMLQGRVEIRGKAVTVFEAKLRV